MTKDYYKILGVSENESAENIKSAYRKLARKWHPDVAGTDAINKFKDINEAYETLSNPEKRREYDKIRKFYSYSSEVKNETNVKQESTKTNAKKQETKFHQYKDDKFKNWFTSAWEDFIAKKQTEQSYKNSQNISKKGEDIYSDIEITIFEAINGTLKTVNMLQTSVCEKCKGRKFINGSICKHCNGKGEFVNHKKFTVKIPAGIKNNSKIRLAKEGGKGINGGENGDLYITVHVKEPTNYKTDGLNILKTIAIAPYEAVLGTTLKISGANGILSVKIMPNTQNGQKIRLAGCGIVQNNQIGDMIITVEIKIPKVLSQEEINLYRKLEEFSSGNVRENLW